MKFQNIKNSELIHILKFKAQTERNLTLEIIELLEELDFRKLHLEMGFGSLLEFCVKELKYSESAAYRRISAMKVVKDVPQAKASLTSGTLNLATLSQAQTFLNQERKYNNKSYTKNEKLDLITSLENKSKRECEKILIEKSHDLPKPERIRQVTPEQTQITITLKSELIEKLEELKHIYSHVNSNASYAELLEIMADQILAKRVLKKKSRVSKFSDVMVKKKAEKKAVQKVKHRAVQKMEQRNTATPPGGAAEYQVSSVQNASRYISAAIKREVYLRDKGCCAFKNMKTNQRCTSKHLLQYDHVKPFSYGGTSKPENLRLLCYNHHKLVTEKVFGSKVTKF